MAIIRCTVNWRDNSFRATRCRLLHRQFVVCAHVDWFDEVTWCKCGTLISTLRVTLWVAIVKESGIPARFYCQKREKKKEITEKEKTSGRVECLKNSSVCGSDESDVFLSGHVI